MNKRKYITLSMVMFITVFLCMAAAQESGSDHSEAETCASCHINPAMPIVVDQWNTSEHGNSYDNGSGANTYCASCKAPMNADPFATSSDNEPVPAEEWQDITCSACHPPHDLRVEWGTPIGNFNVTTGEWMPVYDANELCVYCHSGSRHGKEFASFGKIMFDKKEVKCIDCHMPEIPVMINGETLYVYSHTWLVKENLPYSCGVKGTDSDCHKTHDQVWAEKQIDKMKIHGK